MLLARSTFLSFVFAVSALAQSANVQGVVKDSSGAVIPAATVTVTNIDTSVSAKAASNEQGLYLVPLLNAGRYSVECSAQGFAVKKVDSFRLEVGQTARFDFDLNPGMVTESIQVSAAAVLTMSPTRPTSARRTPASALSRPAPSRPRKIPAASSLH